MRYELTGSAGQSLGAFAVAGMRIEVTGEANDYVAKGSRRHRRRAAGRGSGPGPGGGRQRLPLRRDRRRTAPGRSRGHALRGSQFRRAAVVEGIGAHGCEYMTGGTVVVLGSIGPTSARDDRRAGLPARRRSLIGSSAAVEPARSRQDDRTLLELLAAHAAEGSRRAASILADWDAWRARFAVVEPRVSQTPASVEPLALAR